MKEPCQSCDKAIIKKQTLKISVGKKEYKIKLCSKCCESIGRQLLQSDALLGLSATKGLKFIVFV